MKPDTRCCRGVVVLAVLASVLTAIPPARADWREPVGGPSPINADKTRNASSPSLTTVGGTPHVAWVEETTQPGQGNSSAINVARFTADGTAWERLAPGSPISRVASASSFAPSLADIGGVPWVAWSENAGGDLCPGFPFSPNKQVHAARLASSGDAWTGMDDDAHPIMRDPGGTANDPTMAGSGGRPYVAFWEFDPGSGSAACAGAAPAKVWVVRLSADGSEWETVGGGPVQADPTRDALFPRLAIVDGRPWLSFIQVAASGPPSAEARVARLTDSGSGWEEVGGGPVAVGTFGDIEPPTIASVAGLPTVAVAVGSTDRIRVFRPTADGDDWQQVGNGPASANGTGPTVADMDGVPWVGWTQGGVAHASRLDGDTWREAGGSVAGSGGAAQLASINGFPWIAVTRDDGSSSGGPSTPGCCSQARVARLEPGFGALRAFPSSDTATLLADTDAFGLPYRIGFEYGEERNPGATGATSTTPVRDELALGEARGLKPSTLYWFSPFTTAGTPLPLVRGERDLFATPPRSGATAPPPPPPITVTGRARLIVAIVRAPTRVRRGGRVRVRVLSSEPGNVQLSVVRRGRVIRRIGRSMPAGTVTLTWRTRRAAPRLYRLRVRVRATDGRAASDAVSLRILRRRSSS